MKASPRSDAAGMRRGQWTPDEDQKLHSYIQQHGHGSWSLLPQKAGLKRCGKSCRLRWINYLSPDIKRGNFSLREEQTIIQLHALLGNRWSAIAMYLPRRTDNEIKNYWNTHLKKRLARNGIDPVTHRSRSLTLNDSVNGKASKLRHMAQWESARLEAEARSVRENKLRQNEQLAAAYGSKIPNSMGNNIARPRCLDILTAWQSIVESGISSSSVRYGVGSVNHGNYYDINDQSLTCSVNNANRNGIDENDVLGLRGDGEGQRLVREENFAERDMALVLDDDEGVCGRQLLWNDIVNLLYSDCEPSMF